MKEDISLTYNKIKSKSKLPVGLFYYIKSDFLSDFNFYSFVISFKEEEKSINTMSEIAKQDGFKFFLDSEEGQTFWKNNQETILNALNNSFNFLYQETT